MHPLERARSLLASALAAAAVACGGSDNGNVEPPGEATTIAENGGNNGRGAAGAVVTPAPSVKVTDASSNPVGGIAVTFAVTSGGGSVTGPNQTTDASGIATVGSWTLGPGAGINTLTASAAGLDGSPITFTATADVLGGFLVTLVAGLSHTCGLTGAGVAICWGWNGYGQLGTGSTTSSSTPVAVSGGLSFRTLASGTVHTCGLTSSQTVHCWGRNGEGQLGSGTATGPETCDIDIGGGDKVPEACSTAPVTVIGGLGFNDLATGGWTTGGLTSGGAAYMWGLNDYGQLGNGTTTNTPSPVAVSGGLSFRALTTGTSRSHTCGLTSAGSAYCWGANSSGQLGNGSTTDGSTPVAVAGGLAFTALAAGGRSGTSQGHTCGLTSSGAAYCWGDNSSGQLGDGSTTNRSAPIPVSGGLSFSALAAGMFHTCGLTSAGAAYCWGDNSSGQLGDGSTTSRSTPIPVSGGLSFSAIIAGSLHSCALTSAGAAYCWGWNFYGQLGDGSTADSSVPVRVVGQIP